MFISQVKDAGFRSLDLVQIECSPNEPHLSCFLIFAPRLSTAQKWKTNCVFNPSSLHLSGKQD